MEQVFQSEQIKDLATALSKAQAEIEHAVKSEDNPFFKSKYADLPACIDAAKEALAKNNLSVTQMTAVDENNHAMLVTQLNHSSGQWMRGYYPVRPTKPDPQALGSAMTYARRYAYCAIVGVVAIGEDDDGNSASVKPEQEKKPAEPEKKQVKAKGFNAIRKEIMESDDPAAVWSQNLEEINKIKISSPQSYDDLVKVGAERRAALASMKLAVEEVMGQTNGK